MRNRHLMETRNLVISFDYSWCLTKNLAYACLIMKFHYRNSSSVDFFLIRDIFREIFKIYFFRFSIAKILYYTCFYSLGHSLIKFLFGTVFWNGVEKFTTHLCPPLQATASGSHGGHGGNIRSLSEDRATSHPSPPPPFRGRNSSGNLRPLTRSSRVEEIPDIYWEQAARELDFCTCRKCQVSWL